MGACASTLIITSPKCVCVCVWARHKCVIPLNVCHSRIKQHLHNSFISAHTLPEHTIQQTTHLQAQVHIATNEMNDCSGEFVTKPKKNIVNKLGVCVRLICGAVCARWLGGWQLYTCMTKTNFWPRTFRRSGNGSAKMRERSPGACSEIGRIAAHNQALPRLIFIRMLRCSLFATRTEKTKCHVTW